jgi:hypothetical protein
MTRTCHFALVVLSLIATPMIHPAHACKPCLGDPIDTSLSRANAVLLGKVALVSEYPRGTEKHGAGEAAIEVRVERWLKKPSKQSAKKGRKVPLRIRWDGICLGRPVLPKAGDRAIFFIGESTTENEGVLTGYCSAPFLKVEKGQVSVPTEAVETWGKALSLRAFEDRIRK